MLACSVLIVILGHDILCEMGLVLDFKTQSIAWDDCHVLMHSFPIITTINGVKHPAYSGRTVAFECA